MGECLYYIQKNGQEIGPLSFSQMGSMWGKGEITVRTSFRYENESIWRPVALLQSELDQAMEKPAVHPARKQSKAQKTGSDTKTGCGCLFLGIAVLIIIGAAKGPKPGFTSVPVSTSATRQSDLMPSPADGEAAEPKIAPARPVANDALVVLGVIKDFDSESQVVKLKKLIQENPDSRFIAIVWRYSPTKTSVVDALLLYDRTANQLWRSKAPSADGVRNKPAWVLWTPVNDQKILALKAGTGFDLEGYKAGNGALPVSKEAEKFLREKLSNTPAKEGHASNDANIPRPSASLKAPEDSEQTRTRESSQDKEKDLRLNFINGQTWIGATSKETFEKLSKYAAQKDEAAFGKFVSAGAASGEMTLFKDGEKVILMDTAIFSGLVKVRRPGELAEYWTNFEALKK